MWTHAFASRIKDVLLLIATLPLSLAWPTLAAGDAGAVQTWQWIPMPHVSASLERAARADGEWDALRVTFTKTGAERRLLALETLPQGNPAQAKALSVRYRLQLKQGQPPRLALVVFEKGGGVWFRVGANLLASDSFTEARLPLNSLHKSEIGENAGKEVQWDEVSKVWLGFAFDGPAEGTIELARVVFTAEPYRPTQALRATDGAGAWDVGKDPAVQAKLTTPAEGPDWKPCMKLEFTMPGRRHMYLAPAFPLGEADLDGYQGLRFTYKAALPKGIDGLLVCLNEREGAQYYADPAPPASQEWKTVTIPFGALKLGNWSKDANGRLDLDQIASIVIGLHGTAADETASGTIWAADIEFAP